MAGVATVIGAFNYLHVIKMMYFDEPKNGTAIEAPWVFVPHYG